MIRTLQLLAIFSFVMIYRTLSTGMVFQTALYTVLFASCLSVWGFCHCLTQEEQEGKLHRVRMIHWRVLIENNHKNNFFWRWNNILSSSVLAFAIQDIALMILWVPHKACPLVFLEPPTGSFAPWYLYASLIALQFSAVCLSQRDLNP